MRVPTAPDLVQPEVDAPRRHDVPRPLLFFGGIAAIALLGFGTVTVAARFGDGPTGPFPGGRLSGQQVEGAEADWEAASARPGQDRLNWRAFLFRR